MDTADKPVGGAVRAGNHGRKVRESCAEGTAAGAGRAGQRRVEGFKGRQGAGRSAVDAAHVRGTCTAPRDGGCRRESGWRGRKIRGRKILGQLGWCRKIRGRKILGGMGKGGSGHKLGRHGGEAGKGQGSEGRRRTGRGGRLQAQARRPGVGAREGLLWGRRQEVDGCVGVQRLRPAVAGPQHSGQRGREGVGWGGRPGRGTFCER